MPLNHKLEIKTQGILFLFKLLEKDGSGASHLRSEKVLC